MRPTGSLIQDSILLGLVSDLGKNKYDMPRSYSLVLVSFFFFISQVVAANEDRIENLWIASTLLGLAHGSVFSLFPTVCMEWFGMRKNYFRPLFFHRHLKCSLSQLTSRRTGVTSPYLQWQVATFSRLSLVETSINTTLRTQIAKHPSRKLRRLRLRNAYWA